MSNTKRHQKRLDPTQVNPLKAVIFFASIRVNINESLFFTNWNVCILMQVRINDIIIIASIRVHINESDGNQNIKF